MKYHLTVNNKGQIPKAASEAIKNELLLFAGKRVTISIEVYKKKRSLEQNSYYWVVVVKLISNHTGYTEDEVHEFLKSEFIGIKKVKIGGREIERGKTTTDLTTTDFMGYVAEIQQWASEKLDLYLPDPSELEKTFNV